MWAVLPEGGDAVVTSYRWLTDPCLGLVHPEVTGNCPHHFSSIHADVLESSAEVKPWMQSMYEAKRHNRPTIFLDSVRLTLWGVGK